MMGVLPVTTYVGSVPEIFIHYKDAMILTSDNVIDECVRVLELLDKDRELLYNMRIAVRKNLLETRTWQEVIEHWDKYFDSCDEGVVMVDTGWEETTQWEKNWWGNCANSLFEEEKQKTYAIKMGLKWVGNDKTPHEIDLEGNMRCHQI
jgi:hypothetical protein